MIVSLALFSTVIVISIGALLVLVATNEQLQGEQSVMTNLSFALDSMSREIRTGTHYVCVYGDTSNSAISIPGVNPDPKVFIESTGNQDDHDDMGEVALDCFEGNESASNINGISFIEGGESITGVGAQRIMYYFVDNDITVGTPSERKQGGRIYRRVGSEAAEPITSSGLFIEYAEFFVSGSESLADNPAAIDQPSVTIVIEARERDDPSKTYELQTTVTQRILDI